MPRESPAIPLQVWSPRVRPALHPQHLAGPVPPLLPAPSSPAREVLGATRGLPFHRAEPRGCRPGDRWHPGRAPDLTLDLAVRLPACHCSSALSLGERGLCRWPGAALSSSTGPWPPRPRAPETRPGHAERRECKTHVDSRATVPRKTEDEIARVFTSVTGRVADVLDLLAPVRDLNSAPSIPLFKSDRESVVSSACGLLSISVGKTSGWHAFCR